MFYHRMHSIRNGNAAFLLREDLRSYITVLQSCPCKACYAVNTRQSRSCSLHIRNFRAYFRFDHLVDLKFELFGLFLGGERFSLEFLQLGGNISFRIDQRLFSHIILGNRNLIGIGDFKVIAKDIIEANLQLDARLLFFLFFQLCYIFLAVFRQRADFVKFLGKALLYVLAVLDIPCAVFIHRTIQKVKNGFMHFHLSVQLFQDD